MSEKKKRGRPSKDTNDSTYSVIRDPLMEPYFIQKDRYNFLYDKYDFKKLIFMGDGINDTQILEKCMFGIAPANARIEAKNCADFITESRAGEGAVLDACIEIKKKFID